MFDTELDAALRRIIAEWRLAEERIKAAEMIRDSEVVASSIFELRYAGRKLVQVFSFALDEGGGLVLGSQNYATATKTLQEALECCVKAKHDAIDAIITFMTLYFKDTRTRLNVRLIQKYFPNFLEDISKIRSVQGKITLSRGDSASNREEIYEDIFKNDYPQLLDLYQKISASSDLVTAEINKEKSGKIKRFIFNFVMFVFGTFGVIDLFIKYVLHHG